MCKEHFKPLLNLVEGLTLIRCPFMGVYSSICGLWWKTISLEWRSPMTLRTKVAFLLWPLQTRSQCLRPEGSYSSSMDRSWEGSCKIHLAFKRVWCSEGSEWADWLCYDPRADFQDAKEAFLLIIVSYCVFNKGVIEDSEDVHTDAKWL